MERDNIHVQLRLDAAIRESKLASLTNKDTDNRSIYKWSLSWKALTQRLFNITC